MKNPFDVFLSGGNACNTMKATAKAFSLGHVVELASFTMQTYLFYRIKKNGNSRNQSNFDFLPRNQGCFGDFYNAFPKKR